MIPTKEFVKNREKILEQIAKDRKERPDAIVRKTPTIEEKKDELELVKEEEKNTQVDEISNETKPIEDIVEDIIEKVDETREVEEVEYVEMPMRKELMNSYKVKFGKLPSPKRTDEVIYKKINGIEDAE